MKLAYEKSVSLDYVVNEANQIWKRVKQRNIDITNEAEATKLLEEVRADHEEICKSYPIVIRYMCQMKEYSPSVFKKYIQKLASKGILKAEEYIEMQAEYVVMLYKHTHPRWNASNVSSLRRNMIKILTDEKDAFEKAVKRAEGIVNSREAMLDLANKNDFKVFAKLCGEEGMTKAGTLTLTTDEEIEKFSLDYFDDQLNSDYTSAIKKVNDLLA